MGIDVTVPAPLHISDIETAINWWRERAPSADGVTLDSRLHALVSAYARLALHHQDEISPQALSAEAWAAWLAWYDSTPDTPCIAICSTSQGDAWCKGCGRSFEEVQLWTQMSPTQKRATWRRITQHGLAWRFNRYAERARQPDVSPAAADGDVTHTGQNPGIVQG